MEKTPSFDFAVMYSSSCLTNVPSLRSEFFNHSLEKAETGIVLRSDTGVLLIFLNYSKELTSYTTFKTFHYEYRKYMKDWNPALQKLFLISILYQDLIKQKLFWIQQKDMLKPIKTFKILIHLDAWGVIFIVLRKTYCYLRNLRKQNSFQYSKFSWTVMAFVS